MPYFPESKMPSRLKQESNDIQGNKYVVSASDVNKHNEEIRAIESVLGTGKRVSDTPLGEPTADLSTALFNVITRLQEIRDSQILTTSGVVAIKDVAEPTADGLIDFPSSWPITMLAEGISETGTGDESELDVIPSLELDSVADMPDEGYVTLINDVSTSGIQISDRLLALGSRRTYGKVGEEFNYDFKIIGGSGDPAISVSTLPSGLTLSNDELVGTPTTEGALDVTVSIVDGSETYSYVTSIVIAGSTSPAFTEDMTFTGGLGTPIIPYVLPVTGIIQSVTAVLPDGLTMFGTTIVGSARAIATTTVSVTVTDIFGATATADLEIVITATTLAGG